MRDVTQNPIRTAKWLAFFAIAMFGFGYAMVPLYDVFCTITGINGKTGQISQYDAEAGVVDFNRRVRVQFDTNVKPDLPWDFKAAEYTKMVSPGEISEAVFFVENKSDKPITGRAVPSVAPSSASLFFNKTECFCFTNQLLAPGQRKEVIVRFVVDSELPDKIEQMTLSYTFFRASDSERDVAAISRNPSILIEEKNGKS